MEPEGNNETSLEEETAVEYVSDKDKIKKGSIIVVTVAVFCLAVVFWFIYSVWTASDDFNLPIGIDNEVSQQDVLKKPFVDETKVEGRNPEVLGLTIDTLIGRFFTERATGKTLYVNASGEECVEVCLADWTPYEAIDSLEEGGLLGTVEREDDTLQYTWNGLGLYTYNQDVGDSVLGDGYAGTWEIARP